MTRQSTSDGCSTICCDGCRQSHVMLWCDGQARTNGDGPARACFAMGQPARRHPCDRYGGASRGGRRQRVVGRRQRRGTGQSGWLRAGRRGRRSDPETSPAGKTRTFVPGPAAPGVDAPLRAGLSSEFPLSSAHRERVCVRVRELVGTDGLPPATRIGET